MDALAKQKNTLSFIRKNRAAASLNAIKPSRTESLTEQEAGRIQITPERARLQPSADVGIFTVVPRRHRE